MKIRRTGWMVALVIVGLMAYAGVTLMNMKSKITEASQTQEALQEQADQLQEENAALEYAIENQGDPETIEDIARDKLGLVMPDEKIFYDGGE